MAYDGNDTTYRLDGGEKLPAGTPAVVYRFVPGVFTSALSGRSTNRRMMSF